MNDIIDCYIGKCDEICYHNLNNIDFLHEQLEQCRQNNLTENNNTNGSGIGNLVSIYQNSPEPYNKLAYIELEKIYESTKRSLERWYLPIYVSQRAQRANLLSKYYLMSLSMN